MLLGLRERLGASLALIPALLILILMYHILAGRAALRHNRQIATRRPAKKRPARRRNKHKGQARRNTRTKANKPNRQRSAPVVAFPILEPTTPPYRLSVTVGTVLDEFSERAFAYEWSQVPLSPETWKSQIDSNALDLIFVESAWHGNSGEWRYHLAGGSAPRPALVELVDYARAQGIPTVFWNKEDPPHYQDFLNTARLFDWVFTSDERKIPAYRKDLGHDRVATLAFAAQPAIHNPIRSRKVPRDRGVVFGGMYFRHKYPERREQLDALLPAAVRHKLDIFSRQHGGDSNYQFPLPYDRYVRGALPYDEMLSAYKAYKVVLNVNSVIDSPSMCARRVFEATASGAAVVSGPSRAIPLFFPNGEIRTVASEAEASVELRTLMRSDDYRQRLVHTAQREIWRAHTYAHRAEEVLQTVGVPFSSNVRALPLVSVIVPTIRPHLIDDVVKKAASQRNVRVELIIVQHGFSQDQERIAESAAALGVERCVVISASREKSLGHCLNLAVDASTGDFIARMDDDDYYGPSYLEDLVYAYRYSGADLLGKAAAYCYFEGFDITALIWPDHELRWTSFVRGPTFFGPRKTFEDVPFRDIGASEDTLFLRDLEARGGRIYASDRFNFAIHRSSSSNDHTWTIGDRELLASGEVRFFGPPQRSVFL